MAGPMDSPPRAPPVKYATPLGTRWQKEKAAAGSNAFDYPDDAKYVGPWIIGECVGKGASGRVKIARHRRTGQLAAVKILPLQPFLSSRSAATSTAQAKVDKQRLGIDREIIMMKLMNHPNIMRIYDVYEGDKELYLILEYVEGGELFDFLVNRGRLAPLEALAYFKQIVYGLNYAHVFSIIHRDLKPENILIHSLQPPLIKIADWGMAAFAPPSLQLETSCGSPHYASPEIVNGHKYCGTATDIWSCGVILYALLTGRLPFDDKNVRVLLSKVKAGKYEMPAFVDLWRRTCWLGCSSLTLLSASLWPSPRTPLARGRDPGILYVPAPPVLELAQPLPSALHIDRDLFESLAVIWGRHADLDSIRTDLLSPVGRGTLAKAFYFLLQQHRETTMNEHETLMRVDEILGIEGKIITKQYAAPLSKPGRRSVDTIRAPPSNPASEYLRSVRPIPASLPLPISGASSPPRTAIAHTLPMDRGPTRSHPPSPAGPRPQKSRSQAARTSITRSAPPEFVPNPDLSRLRSQTLGTGSPMVISPRPETTMQSRIHPYAAAGAQLVPWSSPMPDSITPPALSGAPFSPLERHRYSPGSGWPKQTRVDKENMGASGGNQWRPPREEEASKPPPLDVSGVPILSKRSTFSIGSPRPGSPPTGSPSSMGEVRGWFSNLFHWKSAQPLVLYSTRDVAETRAETMRLLEALGVAVTLADPDGRGPRRRGACCSAARRTSTRSRSASASSSRRSRASTACRSPGARWGARPRRGSRSRRAGWARSGRSASASARSGGSTR
ncbi:Pkinase-domain-containing protein [Epithele typhae]|uniref:Pkinase-domain-containing protein n=1 Tax=Epithele typhae TaxID=378194 RepID=UPI0020079881|nr:Pkinase-domain-containing protein [Epithele typhae]KAH9923941.1 Pkinase-domain-containing protein [Epithele typhae]